MIFGFVFDVFWVTVAGAIVVGFIYLAYAQGWFGVATRAQGLRIIDALQRQSVKINERIDKWQAKVAAQESAAVAAKTPTLNDVVNRNRTDSISAAFDLMTKGALTKEQYDKIVADIMKS